MIDVLKLELRFATDALTERSGLLSELMGCLYFHYWLTEKRPVPPRSRD